MKSIVICPGYRPEVAQLVEKTPLATVPLLGENLIAYWLVHLASQGAREVIVIASDRPEAVRASIGNGARWGVKVSVIEERRELTPAEARVRHGGGEGWLPAPDDVVLADHLPGLPQHRLCESYADWFAAAQAWVERAVTPDRVGVSEIAPGVRVGWHTRIHSDATLIPPCWIGEKVRIGPGVTIGPNAIIEDRALVEEGAVISNSIVGPETLVGTLTEVNDSVALGEVLINWQDSSCLHVPDEFLLCSLQGPSTDSTEWFRRATQSLTGSTPPLLPADHVTLPAATHLTS